VATFVISHPPSTAPGHTKPHRAAYGSDQQLAPTEPKITVRLRKAKNKNLAEDEIRSGTGSQGTGRVLRWRGAIGDRPGLCGEPRGLRQRGSLGRSVLTSIRAKPRKLLSSSGWRYGRAGNERCERRADHVPVERSAQGAHLASVSTAKCSRESDRANSARQAGRGCGGSGGSAKRVRVGTSMQGTADRPHALSYDAIPPDLSFGPDEDWTSTRVGERPPLRPRGRWCCPRRENHSWVRSYRWRMEDQPARNLEKRCGPQAGRTAEEERAPSWSRRISRVAEGAPRFS